MPPIVPEQERPDSPGRLQRVANFFVDKAVNADLGESPKMLLGEHSMKEGQELPMFPATAKPRHHRIPKVDLIIEDVAPGRPRREGEAPVNPSNKSWPWGGASKHDALLRVVPEAKHHHKFVARKGAEKLASRFASPDHKHEDLLDQEIMYGQRTIYSRITGLPVLVDGRIAETQSRHTAEQWINPLNPRNIINFKAMYVEKMLTRAVGTSKEGRNNLPKAHLQSGNILILDPATVAAYFGVAVEDWVKQIRGESEIIPQNVVIALGHYLSISDENLKSTSKAIEPPRRGSSEMIARAKAAPLYKAPEVINPHSAPTLEDVDYLHKFVAERTKEQEKQLNPTGRMLSRVEFQALQAIGARIRRNIVEDYLGPDATDEEIEQLSRAIDVYNPKKRR
jgi:hypothetical protein